MSWHCDKCKKPKTVEKTDHYIIVGCEHEAILTIKHEERVKDDYIGRDTKSQ